MSLQKRRYILPVLLLLLALSGCRVDSRLNALDPSGSVGEKQLDLINWSLMLMICVFAVVITIYIYVLIRFRKRKGRPDARTSAWKYQVGNYLDRNPHPCTDCSRFSNREIYV